MIVLSGYKEIDDVLRNLPASLSEKIISAANMRAAKPLVEKEKLLAPEGPTGNLVDSIGAERRGKRANIVGEVWVGPRRRGRYKGFAGHLVEFGTTSRRTKSGANRGIMPKKPFALPAWNSTKDGMEDSIRKELGKSVIRTMKKYLK
jgi:hypothetical protein